MKKIRTKVKRQTGSRQLKETRTIQTDKSNKGKKPQIDRNKENGFVLC